MEIGTVDISTIEFERQLMIEWSAEVVRPHVFAAAERQIGDDLPFLCIRKHWTM